MTLFIRKIGCLLAASVVVSLCLSSVSWAFEDAPQTLPPGATENGQKAKGLATYTMGVVYDFYGLTEKAIEEFKRSAQHEENYAVNLRLGADFARLGKLDDAITALEKVFLYDPENVQARYLLALIYSTRRQYDKAAKEYESILSSLKRADPNNVEVYKYLAQLYYSQKQYQKAIEQFEFVLTLTPNDPDVIFLLGSLYLEQGERQKAIEQFKKALVYDPDNDVCLNSLGYVYAEDGVNLDEAEELIKHALEIDPDNGAYLDSLGWVHFKKGDYARSLELFEKADSQLKDPVIYEHMGDAYLQLKQLDQAKKFWTLSLDLLPDQAGVLEKIKSIE